LNWTVFFLLPLIAGSPGWCEVRFTYTEAKGLGPEAGVMRRDPSDILRVGDRHYLWYTKGEVHHGYDATVWFATSKDGRTWVEQGEALARGPKGGWDEQSVFTPNILRAEDRYWLYYTGVPKPFSNKGEDITKTAIGVAVSSSPDGPWKKLKSNPVLLPSEDPNEFDSLRVDDACLVVRENEIRLYYKGRQWDNTPRNTKMGVAIASIPEGPYRKHPENPVISGGHEVTVWTSEGGVTAMITHVGPNEIRNTLQHAADGIHFSKVEDLSGSIPHGPGVIRSGSPPEWGVHIGRREGFLPFLERFDLVRE